MDIHEKLREINKNRKNNPTFFESPNITFQHNNLSTKVEDFQLISINSKVISKNTLKSSNEKNTQNETYDQSSNEKSEFPSNNLDQAINPFVSLLQKESLKIFIFYSEQSYKSTSSSEIQLLQQLDLVIEKDMELQSLVPKILNQYNMNKTDNNKFINLNSQNLIYKLFMCTEEGDKKLKIHKKEINLCNKTLYHILRKYNQYAFRLEVFQKNNEINSLIKNMNDNYIENQIITPEDLQKQQQRNNSKVQEKVKKQKTSLVLSDNNSSIFGKLQQKSRLSFQNMNTTTSQDNLNLMNNNKKNTEEDSNNKKNQKFSEEIMSQCQLDSKNNNNSKQVNKRKSTIKSENGEIQNNKQNNEKDNNNNLDVESNKVSYDSLILDRCNNNQFVVRKMAESYESQKFNSKDHQSQQSGGFFNIFAACCGNSQQSITTQQNKINIQT